MNRMTLSLRAPARLHWSALGAVLMSAASVSALAAEPAALIAAAKRSPAPPWPAGDERGMANTLGPITTQRCAWHMAQPSARVYEASQVRSNSMPKSPFAGPGGMQPKGTAGVPFSAHAFNSEVMQADAEPAQQGTQLDALGHFARIKNPWDPKGAFPADEAVYYGGLTQKDVKPTPDSPLKKLGIEKVPAFVTRGVVLDMTAVVGRNPVPAGTPFNKKEIDDALAKQGIQIKKGDVVLFHTGWQDMASKDAKAFSAGEPGLGKEGAEYLVSKEVVAIGADQWGLEVVPFEKGVGVFEVHQILLPRNGVYILENMNTAPLVADRAWEFMFVLGHSRITGAVQAIINPVAIR